MSMTYSRRCDDVTGHVVATVKAHDSDSGDNARIRYELATSGDSAQTTRGRLFHVDRETGQLSLAASLADVDTAVYHVSVIATDHGSPPRSSTASFKVIVGYGAASKVMTSRVGMSVYVMSAVCVGCFLLASFLFVVAVLRRRRRQGNRQHHHHHHHHERLETAHILPSYVPDKSRPLRDLEPPPLMHHLPARKLQVNYYIVLRFYT